MSQITRGGGLGAIVLLPLSIFQSQVCLVAVLVLILITQQSGFFVLFLSAHRRLAVELTWALDLGIHLADHRFLPYQPSLLFSYRLLESNSVLRYS